MNKLGARADAALLRRPKGADDHSLATLLAPVSEETFLEYFLEKKRLDVQPEQCDRAATFFRG